MRVYHAGTLPAAEAARHDLNGYSWKLPIHASPGGPFVANPHILAIQNVFTLKMDAYAFPLAIYLSISPHIHIQVYTMLSKKWLV